MALMFSRLARNFIKNGYFPTDDDTLERVANMLRAPEGHCRLFDPCCGEGTALANLQHSLVARDERDSSDIETLGIEFDRERAWHAKQLLHCAIHADMHDVIVKGRSIGLMFLNPPYGYGVADKATRSQADLDHGKAERLERTFLRKTLPLIAPGGILVYIIPHYALDEDIRGMLARNLERLRVFCAPERQFKQSVVIGVRRKSGHPSKEALDMLTRAAQGEEGADMLPREWIEEPYQIPPAPSDQDFEFRAIRIDADQLAVELQRFEGQLLWGQLGTHFNQVSAACRPPLREMTPWHLALALAAGQVNGCVRSNDGRTLLVKGDTFKHKARSVSTEVNEKGEASQTITLLDRFVPVINAIEFTPGDKLGQIVKIA